MSWVAMGSKHRAPFVSWPQATRSTAPAVPRAFRGRRLLRPPPAMDGQASADRRENNRYDEVVTDPETGDVIHETHEPLSEVIEGEALEEVKNELVAAG